jgi:hypothetical protein
MTAVCTTVAIELSGAVITNSARPLDLFFDLARTHFWFGKDVRVLHSSLITQRRCLDTL